jgi:hypothetical protein
MKDELKRNFYIKEVAAKYDIYESVLYRELEKWTGERNRSGSFGAPRTEGSQRSGLAGDPAHGPSAPTEKKRSPVAERDVLKLLLEHPAEMIEFVFSYITIADITDPQIRAIIEFLLSRFDERGPGQVTEIVGEITDPTLKSIVTDIVMSKYELSKRWESNESEIEVADPWMVARDAIVAMKKKILQSQVEENQRALKDASTRGHDAQPFVLRHQELMKQIHDVDTGALFKSS